MKSKVKTKKDPISKGTAGRFTVVMIVMVVLLASMAVFQRLANRRSYGGA